MFDPQMIREMMSPLTDRLDAIQCKLIELHSVNRKINEELITLNERLGPDTAPLLADEPATPEPLASEVGLIAGLVVPLDPPRVDLSEPPTHKPGDQVDVDTPESAAERTHREAVERASSGTADPMQVDPQPGSDVPATD